MVYKNGEKILRENNNLITYINSIDYIRVLPEILPQLEDLIQKKSELLDAFIEKHVGEKLFNLQYRMVNTDKFDAYYKDKNINISLPFRLLARVIENQEDYFPCDKFFYEKNKSLSSNQGTLFDLEKIEMEETKSVMNCPSMIITGQKQAFFKYSSSGAPVVNFLDHTNILRINDFFERSNWNRKYILQQLREITQKDYYKMRLHNRVYFMKFHELIEKPNVNREEIENLIWSISDYDWKEYDYSNCSLWFEEIQKGIEEIIHFFENCAKFENHSILMRHNFHEG